MSANPTRAGKTTATGAASPVKPVVAAPAPTPAPADVADDGKALFQRFQAMLEEQRKQLETTLMDAHRAHVDIECALPRRDRHGSFRPRGNPRRAAASAPSPVCRVPDPAPRGFEVGAPEPAVAPAAKPVGAKPPETAPGSLDGCPPPATDRCARILVTRPKRWRPHGPRGRTRHRLDQAGGDPVGPSRPDAGSSGDRAVGAGPLPHHRRHRRR